MSTFVAYSLVLSLSRPLSLSALSSVTLNSDSRTNVSHSISADIREKYPIYPLPSDVKRRCKGQHYKGVTVTASGNYNVAVTCNGKQIGLGTFEDERTGAIAYAAAREVPLYRALGAVQVLLLGMWPLKTWTMAEKDQISRGIKAPVSDGDGANR